MQRTINEIYDLIQAKKTTAEQDLRLITSPNYAAKNPTIAVYERGYLRGQLEAYIDVLALIVSSRVLDLDKARKHKGGSS